MAFSAWSGQNGYREAVVPHSEAVVPHSEGLAAAGGLRWK